MFAMRTLVAMIHSMSPIIVIPMVIAVRAVRAVIPTMTVVPISLVRSVIVAVPLAMLRIFPML